MMEDKVLGILDDIYVAINVIKDNAATKEDLKAFATKEDLTEALKPYATKEDLKAYATKVDLKTMELSICDKISVKIGQLHGTTVELMKKEDTKTLEILEIMREKKFFDDKDKKRIVIMEPFAQMML